MHNCSGGQTTNLNNSAKINVNNSIHLTRCKGGFMLHPAKPYFRPSLRTEVEIGIRENVGCFRPSSDQSSNEWSLAILLSGITFAFVFCLESFSFPPMFWPCRAIFFLSESLSLQRNEGWNAEEFENVHLLLLMPPHFAWHSTWHYDNKNLVHSRLHFGGGHPSEY